MPKLHSAPHTRNHTKKKQAKATHDDHPPPEDELGGGDICSLEHEPSTEDDKPLD